MPLITCPCEEHAPMREVERNGIHIDVCTKCRGVWLDRGELEKLLTGVRGAAAEFDRERESFERTRANPSQARPQPQPQPQQDMRRYGGEGGEGGERGWFGGEGGEGGERSGAYGQPRKKKSWLEAFDIFD